MMLILLVGAVFVSVLSAGQDKPPVVMCSSFSCAYNKGARCTRKEIAVYDNVVTGLCLFHSELMSKRIIEPLGKVSTIERGKPNPQMIDKIMKAQEDKRDSELLKNPKAFTLWMRRQGIGKNKG